LIQVVNFGLYDAFFPVFSGTILLLLIVFSFFPEYSWFGVYVYLRIKFYSNRIEISTKSGRILSTINNSTVDSVDFKPTFSEFYGVKKIDSEYVTFKLIGFMDDSLVCLNDKIRFSHHEILTMNQTLKSHNNQNIKHVSIAFARKNNLRIVNHY
jgi:hypothetical protein